MSEADKIIESLKNSGRKVEEFYTGNKTSDKNVVTEDDVKILEEFAEICKAGLACYDQTREGEALERILAEREQDKKRIQELEEKMNADNMLIIYELKQKDKRIQELEEERDHWHGCFIVAMENSIAKEKVINVIQEYKDKIERYKEYRIQGKETDVEYYENIANTIIVQVLQELLGEDK